jgi:hypothetical protein
MNLAELKAKGGFVALAPVAKEVTWTHKNDAGEEVKDTFTVFIKRHSFGTIEQIWAGESDRSKSASYIAQSVRLGERGKDALSYEDAFQLDPSLATVLIGAINEVNSTGKSEPKN